VNRVSRASIFLGFSVILSAACWTEPTHEGRPQSEWIRGLTSKEPRSRQKAAAVLGRILAKDPQSDLVREALTRAIEDQDDSVRLTAARALTIPGLNGFAVIAGMHEALHDSVHASVRATAASIIGGLGWERGRAGLASLNEALADTSALVRRAAVEALGAIGERAVAFIPPVARLDSDSSPEVRAAVVAALSRMRMDTASLEPILRKALVDSSSLVRRAAQRVVSGGEMNQPRDQ
jgi:HEAT repeat protein